MKDFTRLFMRLDGSTKTTVKLKALVEYLQAANSINRLWAVAILSHRRPKRPVKTSDLRQWASDLSDIPLWLLEETYHIVGDLAETLANILPEEYSESNFELHEWVEKIINIYGATEEEKESFIKSSWAILSPEERFVFNKIITGGFRVGVSDKLITRAVAQYMDVEASQIAHRMMGNWTPKTTTWEQLFESELDGDNLSRPYPFYLAYAMDVEYEKLGPVEDWTAEYKWDGIRGQVIHRKEEVFIWSRSEDLVTHQYPEIADMALNLPNGTVIDGEILAHDGSKPLPFGQLQKRIGRKKVGKKMLADVPVILMCYDLLEYNGEDIRSEPHALRREKLITLAKKLNHPALHLSTTVEFNSWEALNKMREQARALHNEGFMIKKKASIYQAGRKRGDWWKWKVDPYTIDAVMIYAQRGSGRRANLYTDYTFGVWKDNILVPVAKAYSGLTDKEFNRVDRWIKRNTKERFGPVRSVVPELVFELAFEDINVSTRHKSGIALRFPRMVRWREDKPASEANTIEDVMQLLKAKV